MVSLVGELFRGGQGDETTRLKKSAISMIVLGQADGSAGSDEMPAQHWPDRPNQVLSPVGENRYPPPLMVRITAGLVGSGSILRRIRMIRRSTARSKASLSRALASSSSRSRDSTRFGFAAK